jgi:hypothetical protein
MRIALTIGAIVKASAATPIAPVDQDEDGGQPAKAAGQREHGGEGEPGRAPELAQRKAQVP